MAAENKGNPRIQKPERTSAEEAGMKATEIKEVSGRTAAKEVEPVYSAGEFADNAKQLFEIGRAHV